MKKTQLQNNIIAAASHVILCILLYHAQNWAYKENLLEHLTGSQEIVFAIVYLCMISAVYLLIGRWLMRPVNSTKEKVGSVMGLCVILLIAWVCSLQTVGLAWIAFGTIPFRPAYRIIITWIHQCFVEYSYYLELGLLFVVAFVPSFLLFLTIRKK